MIDGINTIKITGAGGRFTFWVNPANYLPVRANLGPRQTDFHWLAPTPANLAQLKVTVPAGFKQVPAPAGACAPRSLATATPATAPEPPGRPGPGVPPGRAGRGRR